MIDSWSAQVLRLFRESDDPPAPADDAWGAHDFVGALYARDRIGRGIDEAGVDSQAVPPLAIADEMFRMFTVADEDELLSEVGLPIPRDPWYWRRIPRTGPVPRDLNEWKRARLRGDQVDQPGDDPN